MGNRKFENGENWYEQPGKVERVFIANEDFDPESPDGKRLRDIIEGVIQEVAAYAFQSKGVLRIIGAKDNCL
jgi:hypothetical protein